MLVDFLDAGLISDVFGAIKAVTKFPVRFVDVDVVVISTRYKEYFEY